MDLITETPIRKIVVPSGHVLVSVKWKGMDLSKKLAELGQLSFSDGLGLIDFQLSSESAIVYLRESDVICGKSYQSNLMKLRKADCVRIVVLVEYTALTESYFADIQHFVVLLLGLKLVPVGNISDAAQFIHEMAIAESKSHLNPFRDKQDKSKTDKISQQILLKFLQEIPSIDETRAVALLQKFSSIQKICKASKEDLSRIVGPTRAENIKNFINHK